MCAKNHLANELELLLGEIRGWEHMHFVYFSYASFSAYVTGAAMAIEARRGKNPLTGFKEFLCSQLGRRCGSDWPYLIPEQFTNSNSDEVAIEEFHRLFDMFNEQLRQHGLQHILDVAKRLS